MKRVVIHIDRLVLNGFRHEDRHAIAAGLQEQLVQTFGEREAIASLGVRRNTPRLQVGHVRIQHRASPRRVGVSVAGGIGRGLQQ